MGTKSFIQFVVGLSACTTLLLGFAATKVRAGPEYSYELPPAQEGERAIIAPMTTQEQTYVTSRALSGTARVSGRSCDGLVFGSGFLVDGLVLTNRHVAGPTGSIKVEFGSVVESVGVASLAPHFDAAAAYGVEFDALAVGLSWAAQAPQIGEPVLLAGHSRGGATKTVLASVHLLSAGEPYGVSGPVLLIDGPTGLGFSGGPVLDRNGDVVAMLQGFDRSTGLSLAVPGDALQAWLSEDGKSPTVDPVAGQATDEVREGAKLPECS